MRKRVSCLLMTFLLAASVGGQEPVSPAAAEDKLAHVLKRVGESVERYHEGMFSVACTEVWRREELKKDFSPKKASEFVFDSVAVRQAKAEDEEVYFGKIVRRLQTVDGKPAQPNRKRGRYDPSPTGGAYLGFLLPKSQSQTAFTFEGERQEEGRKVYVLGFRPRDEQAAAAKWKGRSVNVHAPWRGLLFVDAENFDVLRYEIRLLEEFEFQSPRAFSGGFFRFGPSRKLRYKTADSTVRFRRVQFKDPERTLLLPVSVESLFVLEGVRHPRVRTTLAYRDYRRFVSDVKVIEDAEPGEAPRD